MKRPKLITIVVLISLVVVVLGSALAVRYFRFKAWAGRLEEIHCSYGINHSGYPGIMGYSPFGDDECLKLTESLALHEGPAIEAVWLPQTEVTDKAVRMLRRLEWLKEVDLSYTNITDDGLSELAGLQQLESLAIVNDLQITGRGLSHLSQLRSLRRFDCRATGIRGADLGSLSQMATLEQLECMQLKISDDDLAAANLPKSLKVLSLAKTGISDAGVAAVCQLSRLRELSLDYNSRITDASVPELSSLRELRVLSIDGTSISAQGREQLRKNLPSCNVEPK